MKRKLPYPIPLLRLKIRLYALSLYSDNYTFINIIDLTNELLRYKEIHECFYFEILKVHVEKALYGLYKPSIEFNELDTYADIDEGIIELLKERPNYFNSLKPRFNALEFEIFKGYLKGKSIREIADSQQRPRNYIIRTYNGVMRKVKNILPRLLSEDFYQYNFEEYDKTFINARRSFGNYETFADPKDEGSPINKPDLLLGYNKEPIIRIEIKNSTNLEELNRVSRTNKFARNNGGYGPLDVYYNGVFTIPISYNDNEYKIYLSSLPQRKFWLKNKAKLLKTYIETNNPVVVTKNDESVMDILFGTFRVAIYDEISEILDLWGSYSRNVIAKSLISTENVDLIQSELKQQLTREISTDITQKLTHSIKNTISGQISRLNRRVKPKKGKPDLNNILEICNDIIDKQSKIITKLVRLNDLYQHKDLFKNVKKENFSTLINHSWDSCKASMPNFKKNKNLRLLSKIKDLNFEDFEIFIDSEYFNEIFTNLFLNSYSHGQYDSIDHGQVTIEVVDKDQDFITVRYMDNGAGMTLEKFDEVYFGWSTNTKNPWAIGTQIIGIIIKRLTNSDPVPITSSNDNNNVIGIQFNIPITKN